MKLTQAIRQCQPLGRAWIDNAWRNFYQERKVKRGKKKGFYEVLYIKGPDRAAFVKVHPSIIRWVPCQDKGPVAHHPV